MRTKKDWSLEKFIADLPPDSFIARYIEMQSVLETPLVYDLWTAMFCLSNAVGRSALVDRPRAPVRLNLYLILTAESGVTRKSTAVNTAMRIMEKFNDATGQSINLIHTRTTPERLEQVLADRSDQGGSAHFAFVVSELVTALGSERYNLAMPGLLTDLFDSPEIRRTTGSVSRGPQTLRRVYGTFLSASTPSWLTRAINPDVIEGGFTSRVFFIISEEPKQRVAWPRLSDQNQESWLVSELVRIREGFSLSKRELDDDKQHRFVLSPDAHRVFTKWYATRQLGVDPFSASFDAREDGHILKCAALLAINGGRGRIDDCDIKSAIAIIDETVKQKSVELLSYQINNVLIDAIEKVRTVLLQNPTGTKHSDMVRRLQAVAKAKRLTTILDTMHALGMVKKFAYTHTAQGRPGVMWTPQPALKSAEFLQIMLENLTGEG
jgi:hypothetical protein